MRAHSSPRREDARGLRRARCHGSRARHRRGVGHRSVLRGRRRGQAARVDPLLGSGSPRRQPIRQAGRRPLRDRGPERDGGDPDRRPRDRPASAVLGRLPARKGGQPPPRSASARDRPVRGAELRGRRLGRSPGRTGRFRIGFKAREGLVLHDRRYDDRGRRRSVILYRASFAEMVVPYGDPSRASYRKNAFDIGEYGLGMLANSLELGCDCLGEIRYFDVHLCNDQGEPYTIKNAICLHEEDAGMLWKHTDAATRPRRGPPLAPPGRLVRSSTVGNYDYGFYWYLYQDGIDPVRGQAHRHRAHGRLAGARAALRHPRRAPAPRPEPPALLQRAARLEHRRAGEHASTRCNVSRRPARAREPARQRVLTRGDAARAARRTRSGPSTRLGPLLEDRQPSVVERARRARSAIGSSRAITSRPSRTPTPRVLERAAFLGPPPLGDAVSTRRSGIRPAITRTSTAAATGCRAGRRRTDPIEDNDIVVWYTFGSHHIPRPEDWPVMPVERIGFMLKPDGFFDRNPALDVPPAPRALSRLSPPSRVLGLLQANTEMGRAGIEPATLGLRVPCSTS